MLEDTSKARDKLEQDFLQAHTDKLVLESQLASIRSGNTSEGYVVSPSRCEIKRLIDFEQFGSHVQASSKLGGCREAVVTAQEKALGDSGRARYD
jgi:hypothetical protein